MNAIILITQGAIGGVGRYESHLVKALGMLARRRETPVFVLSLQRATYEQGDEVHYFSGNNSKIRVLIRYVRLLARFPNAVVIFSHARASSLRLVFGTLPLPRRYAVIGYGVEMWSPVSPVQRIVLRRATLILSISRHTAQMMQDVQGIDPSVIQLLPCTVVPQVSAAVPGGEAHRGVRLLSVCRLAPGETSAKGIDAILSVLPHLIARFPDVQYEIVGEGADRSRLEHLVREQGLDWHVHLTGFLTDLDLQRAYSRCDIFVLPSRQEGFGLVYLEAMAAAKPVIAARAGGTVDVVVDGETGLLVPVDDAPALHDALSTLLSDPALRMRMGNSGLRRAQQEFGFDRFVERLDSAIKLLSGDHHMEKPDTNSAL